VLFDRLRSSISRRLSCRAVCALLVIACLTGPGLAEPYANVTFGGPLEPRDTPRGVLQWAILDMAKAWADCDPSLMDALIADDIDFSFPTTRLQGREAVLEDLAAYCGEQAQSPPETVSFYLPDDAFYIDVAQKRVAAEIQFREFRRGRQQVTNDVWIATIEDGRFTILKEYLDGRVRDLQAAGILTYDWNADFLAPWPPRTEAWGDCFPIVHVAPTNTCPSR
jgi:ketosteroid isomerase-like protein